MYYVLYVDDEPSLLELGKIFLEDLGDYTVTTAQSAPDAIHMLEHVRFDAIISDYQMPGMDGIQFLTEVRNRRGKIPFILFTGRGREEVVIQAINSGADFYLQKGGDPEAQFAELSHKVRQAIQRREAETIIRDYERRETDIINFLPDATFAIDTDGVVIAWNHAMEDLTGVKTAEMLGKGNYEYAIPFYRERRPILIDLVLHDDPVIAAHYPALKKKGRTLFAEGASPYLYNGQGATIWFTAAPLYNTQGKVIGAIESIRDITERTRAETEIVTKHNELREAYDHLTAAEEELRGQIDMLTEGERVIRQSEERLIMAETIGRTGSWEYTIKTGLIWGSAEAHRIFGFSPDAGDFPIQNIESCIPDRERVHTALVELLTEGKAYDIEYAINPADGSAPKMIHSVARLEKDNQGNPIRVIGVIQDITERKRAENILKESERQLNAMASNIPGVVFRFFVNPDKTSGFDYISGRCRQILGLENDPTTFLERFTACIIPENRKQFLESGKDAIRMRKAWEFESQFVKPSGEKIWISAVSSPVMENERLIFDGAIFDKTEQKEKDDFIRILARMADDAPASITVHDFLGNFLYANEETFRLHGFSREEFFAKNLHDIDVPESAQLIAERMQRIRDTGTADFDVQHFRKDGSCLPIHVNVKIIDWGDQKAMLSIATDLTEREQVQDALRKSEEKYRDIFENSVVGLFRTTPGGQIINANDALARIYGYSNAAEIINAGVNARQLYADPKEQEEALHILAEKGSVEDYEVLHLKRDKTRFWVSITARTIRDTDGTVLFYDGTNIDISRRKRAEQALKKSQIQLEEAMDLANLVSWEFDVATGMFTFDDRFYALYGTTAEIEGGYQMPADVYARKFLHPDDQYLVAEEVKKSIQAADPGFTSRVEHRIIRKDGEIRHIVVRFGITKDTQGRTVKTHGANQDITELKRAEETVRHALAEKEVLLREVHHRVKNNLAGIISLIELQINSITNPVHLTQFKELETRIRSMALVHESLYLSKDFTRINIASYTENLVRHLLQVYGEDPAIRCRIDMGDITLPIDTIIPCGLVMNEIITNSLKYAFPEYFSCTVQRGEPCTITITMCREGSDYILTIADNGVGIPPAINVSMAKSLGLYLIGFIISHQLRGTLAISITRGTAYTIRFSEPEDIKENTKK